MTVVFGDNRDRERYRVTLTDEVTVVNSAQGLATYLADHEDEDQLIIARSGHAG